MNEKILEVFGDDAFIEKISNMDDAQDVQKAFEEKGVTLDLDALNAMKSQVSAGADEFSETELEDVSGGGLISKAWKAWNFGKALGIVGRTLYDDARGKGRSYSNKQVGWAINLIDSYNPFK